MADFTITYTDPSGVAKNTPLIGPTIEAALKYLDQYVVFKGKVDIEVVIGPTDSGHFAGSSDLIIVGDKDGKALVNSTIVGEAATGKDPFPFASDIQIYIDPDSEDFKNTWWDPNIATSLKGVVPLDKSDAFSTMLHELLHGMGMTGYRDENTGALSGQYMTVWDSLIEVKDGKAFFIGDSTTALLQGFDAEIHVGGSQGLSHLGGADDTAESDSWWMASSVMHWQTYYGERYQIGRLELAMLEDLGWQVKPTTIVNVLNDWDDDPSYFNIGWETAEQFTGSRWNDLLDGRGGNDVFTASAGEDLIYGGDGKDEARFSNARTTYKIHAEDGYVSVVNSDGDETWLHSVERLTFAGSTIGFDIDGPGGQAYRLYQAAFDRSPDAGGLGYWIKRMDDGTQLRTVAHEFIASQEFRDKYGANPSVEDYVDKLYHNVLHRAPEKEGYEWWVATMKANSANPDIFEEVLVQFSEGAENKLNVLGSIENGFEFTPFG